MLPVKGGLTQSDRTRKCEHTVSQRWLEGSSEHQLPLQFPCEAWFERTGLKDGALTDRRVNAGHDLAQRIMALQGERLGFHDHFLLLEKWDLTDQMNIEEIPQRPSPDARGPVSSSVAASIWVAQGA